ECANVRAHVIAKVMHAVRVIVRFPIWRRAFLMAAETGWPQSLHDVTACFKRIRRAGPSASARRRRQPGPTVAQCHGRHPQSDRKLRLWLRASGRQREVEEFATSL